MVQNFTDFRFGRQLSKKIMTMGETKSRLFIILAHWTYVWDKLECPIDLDMGTSVGLVVVTWVCKENGWIGYVKDGRARRWSAYERIESTYNVYLLVYLSSQYNLLVLWVGTGDTSCTNDWEIIHLGRSFSCTRLRGYSKNWPSKSRVHMYKLWLMVTKFWHRMNKKETIL